MPPEPDDHLLSIIRTGADLVKRQLRSNSETATSVARFAFLLTQKADLSVDHATRKDCDDLVWVGIAIEALELHLQQEKQSRTIKDDFHLQFTVIRLRTKCIKKFGIDPTVDWLQLDKLNELIARHANISSEMYNAETKLVRAYAREDTRDDLRETILKIRHLRQIVNLMRTCFDHDFIHKYIPSILKYIEI